MREIIIKLPPNFCVHLEINVIILYNSNIFYRSENLSNGPPSFHINIYNTVCKILSVSFSLCRLSSSFGMAL